MYIAIRPLFVCLTCLFLCVFAPLREIASADEPPYKRLLTGDDAKKAAELEKKIVELEEADKYGEAIQAVQELLALRQRVQGGDHHEVTSLRSNADVSKAVAVLPATRRAEWRKAVNGSEEARRLESRGQYSQALPLQIAVHELSRQIVGEEHTHTALRASYVAMNLHAQGKYAEAEPIFRKALTVCQTEFGNKHPHTALACNNVAAVLTAQGRHAAAEPLLRQALTICQAAVSDEHPYTALCFNNVATTLTAQAQHAAAEPYYYKALGIRRRLLGEEHSDTIFSFNNLAVNLNAQGKHVQAEPLHRRALALSQKVMGDEHPQTAQCCNELGLNLNAQGQFAAAEPLFRKALAICQKVLGNEHPHLATCCSNLAGNMESQGQHAAAEPYCRQALSIWKQRLGEGHPDTALGGSNLAGNLYAQGRHAEAELPVRQALASFQKVLGKEHPHTARASNSLAVILNGQGKHADAEPRARAAVAGLEAARLRVNIAGLERAAAQNMSPRLAWAISLLNTGQRAAAWQALEGHLGRGLLDDLTARQIRALSANEQSELDSLNTRLAHAERQATSLLAAKGGLEAHREQFDLLVKDRSATGAALAQLAARLQQKDVYDLKQIQARLSADTALIAWLDQTAHPNAARPCGEHWAFLLKAVGEPTVVELRGVGKDGAWTKEDDALPGKVRVLLTSRQREPVNDGPSKGGLSAHVAELYRQRLAPLEEHLKDTQHLVILPSQALAGVPIEAITTRFFISYAPSGTLFARLAESRVQSRAAPSSLLAIADPVFGKAEGTPKDVAAVALRGPDLSPLPGTRREVEAIAALFPKSEKLLGADASKRRLAVLEPRLGEFGVLHFATHGLINQHVALNSAVALSPGPDDDGQVTALTMKDWKLNADLVVLSACETGLGQWRGGEGYLGFSQALFLAGARSIMLSLWPVSDTATALLMVRFYENWLGKRPGLQQPMSKSEALKEAKRWLSNLSRKEVEERIANLPEAARGLKLDLPMADSRQPIADKPFAHPFYWSAFILIGDPN